MTVLSMPTLVLNRSWVAITTTTVKRAFTLLYIGAAKAVEPETYQIHDIDSWLHLPVTDDMETIQAVSRRIRVPEVILLTMFNGMPSTEVVFSRRNLFRRDGNQCQYCAARPGISELSIDHIVPRSRGGISSWENCVLACTSCNRNKGDLTPAEAGMRLLRRPKRPAWAPHIDVALHKRRTSWERFISEAYWDLALEP